MFLTEETIRAGFEPFGRTFESMENAWRQAFEQKKQELAADKLLSKAVRYAKDGKPQQVQKEILGIYQAKIAEGKKQDEERAAQITRAYAECLEESRQTIEQLHHETLEKLSANYAGAVKEQEEAATGTDSVGGKRAAAMTLRITAEKFRELGPYRDSPARAETCGKEAERLQTEANVLEAQEKEEKRRQEEELKRRREEDLKRRKKKRIKICRIAAAMMAAVLGVFLVITQVVLPIKWYREAEAFLEDGNNVAAAIAFGKAGAYRDARERIFTLWDEVSVREAVSASGRNTIGLRSDGTVVVVGDNNYGQCNVQDWTDIVAVSAGSVHTVGLKSDGTVVAVGINGGRCDVQDWTDVVAVSAGDDFTIGLRLDGTVVAVG